MEGRIYKITNQLNGKFYIGMTRKKLKYRFNNHCYDALIRNSNSYFHKAIRKYGKENFIIEEIEICDKNLPDREVFWISELRPDYNQTIGGDNGILGYSHTEKTKKIISQKNTGKFVGNKNPFYNQTHTKNQSISV
jgi:group I intron endonuclease